MAVLLYGARMSAGCGSGTFTLLVVILVISVRR